MIVGTAGHIDHGKTTLVHALTGVDTDRLKEEKARGLSIELGYAYKPLDNGEVLGFVDVPGHERLVRTMAAGACGIDFALLVVAADDGVMPQTLEHLAILDLLGISRGAVALTKIDRVDSRRLCQVEAQLGAVLSGTALQGARIFPLNAAADDPDNLHNNRETAALWRHLQEAAACTPPHPDDGLFRLAVDRVFTLPGHGTVVTGIVFSGRVHAGDTVAVMPGNTPVRVRSIHAQNRPTESGRAGERCALNLAGVAKSAICRGAWLADPRVFAPSMRIDARLRLLANSKLHLASGATIHVHLGTAHHIAHVVLLESKRLSSGEAARVQLVFDTPVCGLPGDRFIARDPQAAHTVGGGVVLDPSAPLRRRRSARRLRYLGAIERMTASRGIAPLLEHAPYGVHMDELVRLTGRAPDRIRIPAEATVISAGGGRFVLLADRWRELGERALAALRDFHGQVPDEPGPDSGRLRRIALPELSHQLWGALIDELVRGGKVIRNGPWLRVPEHTARLSDDDRELAGQLQALIATGRFDPPWVRDLAAAVHEPEERIRQLLRKQAAQGRVCQVVRDLFYDRHCMGELANVIAALAREHGAVDAARYRDALGLGRKRSIQILEFFDRIGYTRRVQDVHVLRPDSTWH